MIKSAKKNANGDRYLELVGTFPLRPLTGDAQLRRAHQVAESLEAKEKLSRDERDYLEVLGDIIEKYEDREVTVEPVSDGEMITFLLRLKKVTQSVVARETGIPSSVLSNVLHGKRRLNRGQIGKLAAYFEVDPTVFDFRSP
ncbi:MAG: helix-turn-helix domain-containing protein [Planctomycetia bacterium]|nr:helix-turn-helix domain-containing protein [Planctomycetia bacterium]